MAALWQRAWPRSGRAQWLVKAVGGVLGLLLLWVLAGMFLLPALLQHWLEAVLAKDIQRPVSVREIRFHPWQVSLTVSGLRVQEADGTVLAGFERLLVDYDMSSLFRLEYGLDAIEWDQPYLRLERDAQGQFTLQALAGPPAPAAEPAAPAAIPPVWVRRLAIGGGAVDYVEALGGQAFTDRLEQLQLTVEDFHTRATRHGNRLSLQVLDGHGGLLEWSGTLGLDPLTLDGKLGVQSLGLTPFIERFMPERSFDLLEGTLSLAIPHHVRVGAGGQPEVQINDARAQVDQVRLAARGQTEAWVELQAIQVGQVAVDLAKRQLQVGRVLLDGGRIRLDRTADGSIRLLTLFAPTGDSAAAAPASAAPAAADRPWQIELQTLALQGYMLQFSDEQVPGGVALEIGPVQLGLSGIRPATADPVPVTLAATLPAEGEVSLAGQATLSPAGFRGNLQARRLSLPLLQPYIAQQARVVLAQGTLDAALDVAMPAADSPDLTLQGTATVRELDVRESQQDRKLLSWQELDIAGLAYGLGQNRLDVASVRVRNPYGRFIINPDGTSNIQALLVEAPAPDAAAPPPPARPLQLSVKEVQVEDADLGFADLTLKPQFRVAIEKLGGHIRDISTDPATRARVELKGKVDRYAPVTIQGQCNVLASPPSLDMTLAFRNIELTTFTPYSGTYAGFMIDKGQLSLDLDYRLEDNRIKGKNHIVMNQLQLGKRVENEKAMDLPIRLALALLRDEKGVIDLGFEIEGNLEEPSFSIGGLFLKVMGNLVRKAVTAPFSLLAGLGGDVPEGADRLAFAFGQSELDAAAQAKVDAVATLLQKRQLLQVNVRGRVVPDEDRLALQEHRLAQDLAGRTGLPAAQFLDPALAVESRAARRLVNHLLHAARHEELRDLEARVQEERQARQQPAGEQVVREQAYRQAWVRLAGEVPVPDSELRQLGLARASQVKDRLMELHGIAPGRIYVLDADPKSAEDAPAAAEVQLQFQAE